MAWLIAQCYRIYSLTYRVIVHNDQYYRQIPPQRDPMILVHWHADDLAMLGPHRNRGYCTLVSLSKDGDLLAYAMEKIGYKIVRGSSSRGGARGFIQLIRAIKAGHDAVITVDGPRGPKHKVKPGAAMLAYKTGAAIQPLGAIARPRYLFRKTWSGTYLPAPFAQVQIKYDETIIPPPENNSEEALAACTARIEDALIRIHEELDRLI